jgi:hypothetical protein
MLTLQGKQPCVKEVYICLHHTFGIRVHPPACGLQRKSLKIWSIPAISRERERIFASSVSPPQEINNEIAKLPPIEWRCIEVNGRNKWVNLFTQFLSVGPTVKVCE